MRRVKRDEEFKPHDDIIMKQIPGADADAAEVSRASIRTKYATTQTNIDGAANVDALKTVVESMDE
jgi:hypothetical protein